ncbi:MAG: hypothetical protein M3Y39_22565, partial [Chloroflexota bacterium]|nr:hypothetical protein [Chloroflexota bacterium]
MKILWRSQEPGRIKKQRRIQINLRIIIIIIGVIIIVAFTILACILAVLHPEYTNQIIVVTSIASVAAGILTAFLQSASSHKETPNRDASPRVSDSIVSAINQSSQETHNHISSTQPLENEPVSVGRASGQVVT